MRYYFAPLEGITGSVFRRIYDEFFGGIDAYYTPFLTTRDGGIMKKKELRDIHPENNKGLSIVPQLMTTKAEEFLQASVHIRELGYGEVNLNLGCPSGTVVPKGKGAGFLRTPELLDGFLEEIFARCPLAISIKSRIGFRDPEEYLQLLEIYEKYPAKLLIWHLRTREEWYEPGVHEEVFREIMAKNNRGITLCYNGDVATQADVDRLTKEYPQLEHVMIGRGYLSHPGFAGNDGKKASFEDRKTVLEFIRTLQERYSEVLYGETPVLFKMKELWGYLKDTFPEKEKLFKRIKKSKNLHEYETVIKELEG